MGEKSTKEEKVLPSHAIKIEKQLDILKAFVVLSERGKKTTSYKEVAPLAGIKSKTNVSGCLKFWYSIGFLEKENKKYKASDITVEFFRKLESGNENDAWSLIRAHLAKTWFGESIISAFKIRSLLSENDLVNVLGSASGVVKRDNMTIRSLKAIVKLLELSKVIIKDEKESYRLNQELTKGVKRREVKLPEDKDVIIITIGEESFVLEVKDLKEFVRNRGKRLAKEKIELEEDD